jgi:hypothetical protein
MTKSCAEVEEVLAAIAAEGRPGDAGEPHLSNCPTCRERLDRMRGLVRELESFDDVLPRLEARPPLLPPAAPRLTPARAALFAAAVLVFTFILWAVTRGPEAGKTTVAQNWEQVPEPPDFLFRPQRRLSLTLENASIEHALQEVFGPFGIQKVDWEPKTAALVSLRLKDATFWEAYYGIMGAADLKGIAFGPRIVGHPRPEDPETRRVVVGDARIAAEVVRSSEGPRLYLTAEFPPSTQSVQADVTNLDLKSDKGAPLTAGRVRYSTPVKMADGSTQDWSFDARSSLHRYTGESSRLLETRVLSPEELRGASVLNLRGTIRLAFPVRPRTYRHRLAIGDVLSVQEAGAKVTFSRKAEKLAVEYDVKEPHHVWTCIQRHDGLVFQDWEGEGKGGNGMTGPVYDLLKVDDLPFTAWASFYDSVEWVEFPFELKDIPVPTH